MLTPHTNTHTYTHTSIAEILYMIFVIIRTQAPREIDAWRIIPISFSFVAYELRVCVHRTKRWLFHHRKTMTKVRCDEIYWKWNLFIFKFIRQNENETTSKMKKWNDFGLANRKKTKFPLFIFDALFGIVSGIKAVYLVYFVNFFSIFVRFSFFFFLRSPFLLGKTLCALRF